MRSARLCGSVSKGCSRLVLRLTGPLYPVRYEITLLNHSPLFPTIRLFGFDLVYGAGFRSVQSSRAGPVWGYLRYPWPLHLHCSGGWPSPNSRNCPGRRRGREDLRGCSQERGQRGQCWPDLYRAEWRCLNADCWPKRRVGFHPGCRSFEWGWRRWVGGSVDP